MDNSTSLLEQNVSINGINSTRVISRSFRRNLINDRFIKIPFQVNIKNIIENCSFFLFVLSILINIYY